MMKRGLAVLWVVLSSASSVACGSDEDVYCCAVGKMASQCTDSTLKKIADSGNAEACKFTLEQNELDCNRALAGSTPSYYHEDEAIAECSAE
jgi:hypothetical protein